jgi:hypothetical protein
LFTERCIQNGQQLLLEQSFQFLHIFNLLAVGFVAKFSKDLLRGSAAQISADERGLKVVQRIPVDFFTNRNDFLDALGKIFSRARYRLLHPIEEASFFFFFQTAEQSLNHKRGFKPPL